MIYEPVKNMIYEPDLITTGEAMYMMKIVINSGWYTIGSHYLLKFRHSPYSQI